MGKNLQKIFSAEALFPILYHIALKLNSRRDEKL